MKVTLIWFIFMVCILNVIFAVPGEGNIRIDSEGEHCLFIYPSSEVRWDAISVEKNSYPSTWRATTAIVTVYKDNIIIINDVLDGSIGRHKINVSSN